MENLQNSTPENGGTATAEMPPEPTTGTVPQNGDATGEQGAPVSEETFTRVDPKTLPPQLRSTYDNMLKDYKTKTTALSETIKAESAKAAEAFKSKAELYDQIATQEEFVRQWNEYVQKSQAQGQNPQEGDPVLSQMKAQIQEMNQKIQLSEMSQITEAFIEAVDDKGTKLHPEFDALNNIVLGSMQNGQKAEEFSLLRACIELSPGKTPQEKLANGYKSAKASYDAIFEAGKKAGMGRLQTKMQNGSQPPSHSGGDVLTMTERKPKSAREALEMAKRGQVVSRD